MQVVGVGDLARDLVGRIRLGDRAQVPFGVRSLVVGVGLLRGVVESDRGNAVERVVGVGCQLPLGVGLREEVAGGVIGVDRAAGVGTRLLRKVAKPINRVTSDQVSWIGNLRKRIEAVI